MLFLLTDTLNFQLPSTQKSINIHRHNFISNLKEKVDFNFQNSKPCLLTHDESLDLNPQKARLISAHPFQQLLLTQWVAVDFIWAGIEAEAGWPITVIGLISCSCWELPSRVARSVWLFGDLCPYHKGRLFWPISDSIIGPYLSPTTGTWESITRADFWSKFTLGASTNFTILKLHISVI